MTACLFIGVLYLIGYERLLIRLRHLLFTSVLIWQEGVNFDKLCTSNSNDRNDDVSNDACNGSSLSNSVNVYMKMLANDFFLVECS